MSRTSVAFIALVVAGIVAPLLGVYPTFLMKCWAFALFACAFNLLLGFTGLLSFGHAAFFASAAYVAGYSMREWGVTPEVGILGGTLFAAVLDAARAHGAAIPVVPVVDTVKRVDALGRVVETLDRGTLRAVQTPQGFAGPLLRRAHAEVRADATDDASMVEALGAPVMTVPGSPANLKVTTPADLVLARALLAGIAEE